MLSYIKHIHLVTLQWKTFTGILCFLNIGIEDVIHTRLKKYQHCEKTLEKHFHPEGTLFAKLKNKSAC